MTVLAAVRRGALLAAVLAALAPGVAHAVPPSIGALETVAVTSTTATVRTVINPNGLSTRYRVNYGSLAGQSVSLPYVDIGNGTVPVTVTVKLTDLEPFTLHAYLFRAENADGVNDDPVGDFTTTKPEPTVTTSAASDVTLTGATLHGTVHPHDLKSVYSFQVSPDPLFPTFFQLSSGEASGNAAVPVSAVVSALTPGTLYYYRLSASNEGGPSFSDPVGSFRTASTPTPTPPAGGAPVVVAAAPPAPAPAAPKVSANGRSLTCAAGGTPCTAQVVVTVPTPKVNKKKPKTKTTVIAKAVVTIAAGSTRPLTYKLNAAGTKLLRAKRKLTATVKTTIAYGADAPLITTSKVVLRAPKRR